MKKLGIVAALALVTTIGGVYATWNYAEGAMQSVTSQGKTIDITLSKTDTPSGTIKFHNSLALWIDDEGTGKENVANYTPGWDDYYGTGGDGAANAGELVIQFVPNSGATQVTLQYRIYIKAGTNTYMDWVNGDKTNTEEKKIFIVDDDTNIKTDTFTYNYNSQDAANGKVTISYNDFIDLLPVNQTFTVSTAEEYEHFAEAIGNIVLYAEVTEVTTPAQQQ